VMGYSPDSDGNAGFATPRPLHMPLVPQARGFIIGPVTSAPLTAPAGHTYSSQLSGFAVASSAGSTIVNGTANAQAGYPTHYAGDSSSSSGVGYGDALSAALSFQLLPLTPLANARAGGHLP
jgi:hypothetical protein